ncbi:MAG: hypothetical protein WC050_03905 [Candidatus Paceibacterota bacterium]
MTRQKYSIAKVPVTLFKKYLLLFTVWAASFLAAAFLPVDTIFKGLLSLPGGAALVYALYQLWREDQQHRRNLFLQDRQQDFILSTSSHFAAVAYDKHVLFCEEYIKRIQEGRQELFRDGASKNAMNIGGDLVRIRQKHAAWLTSEIENQLKPFEQVLIEIGSKEHYLEMTQGKGMDERKRQVIEKIYRSFGLVLGHETPSNEQEAELHIDKVIDRIRDIIGIKEITRLRISTTKLSLERLGES